jgi:hypothetical protein
MNNDSTIKKLSFVKRPIPIPPDYRPIFKIAQIAMILGLCCHSNKGSLLKLHLFSWALKTAENGSKLILWVNSGFNTDFTVWGIEPTLNRGLQYAIAEGICGKSNGKFDLTQKGICFLQNIISDEDLFVTEKYLLQNIGKKISDTKIADLAKKWTLFYVKD